MTPRAKKYLERARYCDEMGTTRMRPIPRLCCVTSPFNGAP
jgi:hypothetical protein